VKDVVFYDFDFNRIGDFRRYTSVNFTKNYCGYGTAEVHFSLAMSEIIELLEENPYVFFIFEEFSAIVTGWQIGDDIAIFGRTPEWLLTKRVLEPLEKESATPEVTARNAVSSAAGDFLALGKLLGIGEKEEYSTSKVRLLHDVVSEVLNAKNLGFEVLPDISAKQFVFRVFEGEEKTVLFSLSNRTAYDITYTVEKQDMVSGAGWYERKFEDMGEWNANKNNPSLSNNKSVNYFRFYKIVTASDGGYEKFDLTCKNGEYLYCDTEDGKWKTMAAKPSTGWVYIDNSTETGAKKWEALLRGSKTEEEAVAEVADLTSKENSAMEVKNVEYGKDYKLGDIVRVQPEFGSFKKTVKKRVKSVNIYFDVNKSGIMPVLNSLEE